MLFTNTHFRTLEENNFLGDYSNRFKNAEDFNNFIDKELEITNIDIFLSSIIDIDNSNNDNIDNSSLESRELLLRANIYVNKENLKEWLQEEYDEFNLLTNFNHKIELLIKLDRLCKFFYPDFNDKKILKKFKKDIIEEEPIKTELKEQKEPKKPINDIKSQNNSDKVEIEEPKNNNNLLIYIFMIITIVMITIIYISENKQKNIHSSESNKTLDINNSESNKTLDINNSESNTTLDINSSKSNKTLDINSSEFNITK